MRKELAQRWIDALRSGEYTQGRNFLRRPGAAGDPDLYCCLGVLCEIAVQDKVIRPSMIGVGCNDNSVYIYEGFAEQIPPQKVAEWSGVPHEDLHQLAQYNDVGHSFNEIAERIHKWYIEKGDRDGQE